MESSTYYVQRLQIIYIQNSTKAPLQNDRASIFSQAAQQKPCLRAMLFSSLHFRVVSTTVLQAARAVGRRGKLWFEAWLLELSHNWQPRSLTFWGSTISHEINQTWRQLFLFGGNRQRAPGMKLAFNVQAVQGHIPNVETKQNQNLFTYQPE